MRYYNLGDRSSWVDFSTAVIQGIAPDKTLYFPQYIPSFSQEVIDSLPHYNDHEIASLIIEQFVGDCLDELTVDQIAYKTLTFDFPLVPLETNLFCLELFNGPTLAFKDVGARFMAHTLSKLTNSRLNKKITVLAATSGDTGSAVASGFYNVENIDVVILYPKGKVSSIQKAQMTSLGGNIKTLEIEGTFDNCQEFVKRSFVDIEIKERLALTSANSINIARWLPQVIYYFIAYKQLPLSKHPIVCSVPSGNFGNLCAGILAKKMGLPIDHFIASCNINNSVINYLNTGEYQPIIPSKQTISNAMDVGDPSNFVRIKELYSIYGDSYKVFQQLKRDLSGYWYDDHQTRGAIQELYHQYRYIADPHGAVGYLGLKQFLNQYSFTTHFRGIFLETAHPIKFREVVEKEIDTQIPMPIRLSRTLSNRNNSSTSISSFDQFKDYLMSRY